MRDRVSRYSGRVRLLPVQGQENTYDMIRADDPIQEGTPLNKDTFLQDGTAEKFGLGSDSTVNDVLSIIGVGFSAVETPVLTIADETLTISSIDSKASKVRLYRNGEPFTDVTGVTSGSANYPLTGLTWDDGVYSITAKTLANGYSDSQFSNSVVLTVGEISSSLPSAEGVSF